MSSPTQELRALLRSFNSSQWLDLFVRSADWQLFMSKPGGRPNPLLSEPGVEISGQEISVTAPHLGIFSPRVRAGAVVKAEDEIAVLKVLDRETSVLAGHDGTITEMCDDDGKLIEFGQPLASLVPA